MLCERALDEFRGRGYVRLGKPFTDGEIREIADAYDEVLVFSSLTLHRTGPNRTDEPRRSWIIQYCHGHVAKDGRPLDAPYRDRPFDFVRLLRYAAGVLAPR